MWKEALITINQQQNPPLAEPIATQKSTNSWKGAPSSNDANSKVNSLPPGTRTPTLPTSTSAHACATASPEASWANVSEAMYVPSAGSRLSSHCLGTTHSLLSFTPPTGRGVVGANTAR